MSDDVAPHDLSGVWHGFYNMPRGGRQTQFEAALRDADGLLSGLTNEIGDSRDCAGQILHAVIEGRRDGTSVHFEKRYDYLPRAHYMILYDGALQADGDEIEGIWTIPGVWSGTFLMIRGGKAGVAIERQVGEKV